MRTFIAGARQKWNGPIKSGADNAKAQVWAAMGAYYYRNVEFRMELLRLFVGPKNAIKTCASLIEDGLELAKGTLARF